MKRLKTIIESLRVFKRLRAIEAATAKLIWMVERADLSNKEASRRIGLHGTRISALETTVSAHTTCYRCGSFHSREVTHHMRLWKPNNDTANPCREQLVTACVWCVPVLKTRGFELETKGMMS